MKDLKSFIHEYRGAIIGGIISIVILCTGLLKLVLGLLVLAIGVFLGNYVQQNKYEVKQKLLDFINKI